MTAAGVCCGHRPDCLCYRSPLLETCFPNECSSLHVVKTKSGDCHDDYHNFRADCHDGCLDCHHECCDDCHDDCLDECHICRDVSHNCHDDCHDNYHDDCHDDCLDNHRDERSCNHPSIFYPERRLNLYATGRSLRH